MSKYTFPDGPPDILGRTMTYEKFINLMTDAWLEASRTEGREPEPIFRKALFYILDTKVEALPPQEVEE